MAVAAAGETTSKWNYRMLLGQGTFTMVGGHLASYSLVLPFLYTACGGSVFVAGLLVPFVRGTGVLAEAASVPIVEHARFHKRYIALTLAVGVLGLVIVCLESRSGERSLLLWAFLAAALLLGPSSALNGLAARDLTGRMLPADQQTTLAFAQTGYAAVLTVAFALFGQHFINSGGAIGEHIELIWYGVGVFVLATVVVLMVREPERARASGVPDQPLAGNRSTVPFREKFAVALRRSWIRHFIIARMLLMSVELAIPFFAIHAASLYSSHAHSLNVFVIASSAGLAIGALVWPRLGKKSLRLVMVLGALITAAASLLSLVIALVPGLQSAAWHSVVFVLAGIGVEGVLNARCVYIVARSSDDERPANIAVSTIVTGVFGIGLAVVFAAIAHLQGVIWPIWCIAGLNVAAALFALSLADVRPTEMAAEARRLVTQLHQAARPHGN